MLELTFVLVNLWPSHYLLRINAFLLVFLIPDDHTNELRLRQSTPENWLQSDHLYTSGSEYELSLRADDARRYAEHITRAMEQEELIVDAERQRRKYSRPSQSSGNSDFSGHSYLPSSFTLSSPEMSQLTSPCSLSEIPSYFFCNPRNSNETDSVSSGTPGGETARFLVSQAYMDASEHLQQRDSGTFTDSNLDSNSYLKVPSNSKHYQRIRLSSDWASKRKSMLMKQSNLRCSLSKQSPGVTDAVSPNSFRWSSWDSGTEKPTPLQTEEKGIIGAGSLIDPNMLYRFNPRSVREPLQCQGEPIKSTSKYSPTNKGQAAHTLLCTSWPIGNLFQWKSKP